MGASQFGSVGKKSTCNAGDSGDVGLIPRSYPWPGKIPLKKGMATHSNLKRKKKQQQKIPPAFLVDKKLPAVLLKFWFLGSSNNDTTGAAGRRWWTGGWPGPEWPGAV